jgi:hypothetical protein
VTPPRISVALLAAAVVAGSFAWTVQSSAASALETTIKLQSQPVDAPDAAPPSLEENRKILAVLGTSIGIRKRIDSLLSDVEASIASLEKRQAASLDLAQRGRAELRGIAGALGGAVGATRTSVRRLGALRARLDVSERLAGEIARELRKLDHKLGPSAGNRP